MQVPATFQYSDGDAYHFMEDGTFETLSLAPARSATTASCWSTTSS